METQQIMYLILELLLITRNVEVSGSFQHGMFLDSDSYKQFDNIGIKQCAKRCYAEADCQSINFFKTTFTCFLNYHNSQYKQLVPNAEFAYGDRSHMSQYFSATKDCLNGQVSLEMHDDSSYCYDGECKRNSIKSRLHWENIPNLEVSASSTHPDCSPQRASLSSTNNGSYAFAACWCPYSNNVPYEYLQIKFNTTYKIYGVVIQGRPNSAQGVTSYWVNSSDDTVQWTQNGGSYTGNNGPDTLVTSILSSVIKTKYLRIIPVSSYDYPSLRFDLIGCEVQV